MKTRILCVEDEELLLGDIAEELSDEGFETLTATNGKQAIEILKQQSVDLILCDIMMPLVDGPTTMKLVRERLPQHNEVPFIFLTAKATREDILAGKKLGVDDYLTKPIDYDLLLATIRTRLNQVDRIRETNEERLKRIYRSLKDQHPNHKPLSISLIANMEKYILPIERALGELGCLVEFVHESHLAHRKDITEQNDLCFLVYSKQVHFYLNSLIKAGKENGGGRIVLLCKDSVDQSLKDALLELGIGYTIDYPYPPVEIFKIILKTAQGN
ncbi:Response regulator receiver domain-containing protein [Cohaesibacter sp. ES.047]|uniref:response regulator n=1 Tax=Cohaesibacter sp. ES.047 TaxID=1798205 RepID=UPI000BBF640A|nr:response regulator [Cohaesibacter sp. ES.047]SNY90588.1 Response regulator receiver domain-containing protein [Cohaesibacter sp. ES.047]